MLNPSARSVWNAALSPSDRVLILGGSGWFGRTAWALTQLPANRILSIGSRSRRVDAGESSYTVSSYDLDVVAEFSPTVVLDFWFLTRDRALIMSPDEYERLNLELIGRTQRIMRLPSVRKLVSLSSGAAISEAKNSDMGDAASAYGRLKALSERTLTEEGDVTGVPTVIARVYSVSGCLVPEPRKYAFSDIAAQALTGEVLVSATKRVIRNYVAVEDVLATALGGTNGDLTVFSTGGQPVEVGELADLFRRLVGSGNVVRPPFDWSESADCYLATDDSWEREVDAAGVKPLSLEEQARNVLECFSLQRS